MLSAYKYEILAILALVLIVFIIIVLQPAYKKFRSLELFNAIWKWKWKGKSLYTLSCYCPECEGELYFDDEHAKSSQNLQEKITFLICKNCGDKEIGRVQGGDRNYVLSLVKRQIQKKLNDKDFS